jgi:hypothetical protein
MMRCFRVALVGALAALVSAGTAVVGGAASSATGTSVAVFHPPRADARTISNDVVGSTNWSGYAAESPSQFSDAIGNWSQPTAACSRSTTSYASFWVGLDGYSSNSVEQIGTDSDCSRGTPTYYAWYEMYPAGSVSLSTSKYPVKAGDTLKGEVSRSGTKYTLTLQSSRGWNFTTVQSGNDANSSAEWVAEAPEICSFIFCRLASLTNFGTVAFTNGAAATGGADAAISTFTYDSGPHDIIMETSSGASKAVPSLLAGGSFAVTWEHS